MIASLKVSGKHGFTHQALTPSARPFAAALSLRNPLITMIGIPVVARRCEDGEPW